ncbi:MAG: MATE family efflux transporter [Muribaculaceae bacterium]|nr:MATE family efflux transporter [Muribaculaceae bacterium]
MNLLNKYITDYKSIIRLGLPILIGQLGMIVVGFADNIMLGRYSTEALASASFVNNMFNVAIFACMGFTYGLTPIVATLFSREQHHEIGSNVRVGLIFNILFAGIVTIVMSIIYYNIERMGQPEELIPLIKPYFLIYLAGVIPITVFSVFSQWSYGIKNTRMPMWIILAGNLLNIIGNYILIYGHWGMPEMGLIGAGSSTLFTRLFCVVVILSIFFFKKKYSVYATGFRHGTIKPGLISKINRTSWPVAMQMSMESGSFTFAAVVAGWLGAIELASFQVTVIIGTLGFCIYYSIGAAVSVLVANEAGKADRKAMRRVGFAGYHVILFCALCSSTLFLSLGETLVHVFTEDVRVITTTVGILAPLVLYQLADATQINFANALRGTSKVMPMLWIAFVSYIIIGAPATYILAIPLNLGMYGIILSFSVSLFVAATGFLFFFLQSTRS